MTYVNMDSPVFSCDDLNSEGNAATLTEKVDAFEKQMILMALQCSRSVTQAADILKVSKQRLHYKIEKHEIDWKSVILRIHSDEAKEEVGTFFHGNNSFVEKLESYEKQLILDALKASINSKSAADLLGISKQALNYKLNKYKIKEK